MKRRGGFSLRSRLLLAVTVAVAFALMIASFVTRTSLQRFLVSRANERLATATETIEHSLDSRFSFEDGSQQLRDLVIEGTFVEIRSAVGEVETSFVVGRRSNTDDLPAVPANGIGPRFLTVPTQDGRGAPFRVMQSTLRDGRELVVAVSLADEESTLEKLTTTAIAVSVGALALAAAVGWIFVRVGLRPLRDVERTAAAIAQGDLERRVPGESPRTEVGRLAKAFNTMLDRIQGAFATRDLKEEELRVSEQRMRRFVGDASHELRTPLAAVAAYTELFSLGARQHPEDLERSMTGIRKETSRMGELVQDLLALARIDDGHPLDRRPVELVSVAAEAIQAANVIDPAFGVKLTAAGPIDMRGDASRLRQVFDNLLANVRAHTPPGTHTVISLASGRDEATIVVADNGPGMSKDQAAKIFERFYRVDPSRSRRSGGAGLGLSIVEAIIVAHGGRVQVESEPGKGTVFTFRLPFVATTPVDS